MYTCMYTYVCIDAQHVHMCANANTRGDEASIEEALKALSAEMPSYLPRPEPHSKLHRVVERPLRALVKANQPLLMQPIVMKQSCG